MQLLAVIQRAADAEREGNYALELCSWPEVSALPSTASWEGATCADGSFPPANQTRADREYHTFNSSRASGFTCNVVQIQEFLYVETMATVTAWMSDNGQYLMFPGGFHELQLKCDVRDRDLQRLGQRLLSLKPPPSSMATAPAPADCGRTAHRPLRASSGSCLLPRHQKKSFH